MGTATSARSTCDHCQAPLESGHFACRFCDTTYCPFCDRAAYARCPHFIVSLDGDRGLAWEGKPVTGPWLAEAAGRRLTTEEEEGLFGEARPLLAAYGGDLSRPPDLRLLIDLAIQRIDWPVVRIEASQGRRSDYFALVPGAAYEALEAILTRLYAAVDQLKHLLTRPTERDAGVEGQGARVRSRFFAYRQAVYLPRELYQCSVCGEYNGSVEPLGLGASGLELELRCLCRGISCPGCGVAGMHRPASFRVLGNAISYVPTVARLAVCGDCTAKRKLAARAVGRVRGGGE